LNGRTPPSNGALRVLALPWARLAVLLVPALLYAPRLGDFFVSDDFDLLHWAVVTSAVEGIVRPPWTTWLRPATDLLWQVTEAAFGQHPTGHHVVNLALHLVNTSLVWSIAWRTTASRAASVAAALLFGVHPTACEAVQWLSGRYDLLATAFGLAALVLASESADRRRPRLAVVSFLLAVLALMAKEAAVAIPLVAAVLASPWLARTTARGRPLVPFTLAAAMMALVPIYLGVRWVLFGGLGGYGWHGRLDLVQLLNPLLSLPLATLPWHLDSPLDGMSSLPWVGVAVASAVALAWRAPLFACAYLAAFVPILNMTGSGGFITAEVARLMYLPLAMVAVGAGVVVDAAAARAPRATALACAVALSVAVTGTWIRLGAWREAATVSTAVQGLLARERTGMAFPALVDCSLLPDNIRGAWVYRTGCDAHAKLVIGERAARGTRLHDPVWPQRDGFASWWCVAADGRSLRRGLCDGP
jgi:hypothetical protein